ncbi:TOBE domain-containing protein [Streptomyces sp. NPDC008139]|uniref:TOBE domain-containing protein n=1 Tax=Streptomyces sp. NPDC008139 TaxID=3364814 RepID=UPI0036ED7FE3
MRIRPEEVSVTDSASAVNTFEAVARSTPYHGRDFTVQAELPDGAALSVRTPVRPETGTC